MIFTSFGFLIFFPAVIIVYYFLPARLRPWFLLIASYYFYINLKPVYGILLAGVTLTTYVFAILIEDTRNEKARKALLILDIIITLLPLFFFKYYNFVNNGVYHWLLSAGIRWPLPEITLILPVGISFYTFMALGYCIDVYNEEIKAENNLGIVALFLAFFPTVLSGPIERAGNMFRQFRGRTYFDYNKVVRGFQFMLWGYFMKLVVANRVAILVSVIFNDVDHKSGASLFEAVLFYPFQVYADLGGYSLIAIGCASVMGIDVMQNFHRPFFAMSMSQFWRRWHISLISWLTDYIYTPLAFNLRRLKMLGTVIALLLTFLISGIWHGAAMTFILWGLLQGSFLSIEAVTNKKRKSFLKKYNLTKKRWFVFISCLFTYLLFAFSELFCGPVDSINHAIAIITKIFSNFRGTLYYNSPSTITFTLFGIIFLFLAEWKEEYHEERFTLLNNRNWFIRNISYALLIIIILLVGVFDGGQFIYFQF
ncbi:MAG TPA: MBOAT family O-acyltransferase [Chitinophagaceae bacterium]